MAAALEAETPSRAASTSRIFSTAFSAALAAAPRRANPNAPRRGSDVQANIAISFEEAAKGCKKTVTYAQIETCSDCHGTGRGGRHVSQNL